MSEGAEAFDASPERGAVRPLGIFAAWRLQVYGCTLKAYRREVVEDVRLYGEMHRFIPVYAAWEGARFTEIEVAHHPRPLGKSKYRLGRIARVVARSRW